MTNISGLGQFLRGFAKSEKRAERPTEHGWYPFITISRQAGAGGHTLAETLMKRLHAERADPLYANWQVFDQELCRRVADDPALRVSLTHLIEERYRGAVEDYLVQAVVGTSPQLKVHQAVFRVITGLAAVGKAVIVGRGANFLTRGYPRGVHVRLVAPLEKRIAVFSEQNRLSRKEARARIETIDRDRARMIRDYFSADIDDPLHYDAVWNTGSASIDFIAVALVEMVRLKAEMEFGEPASL